MVSVVSSLRFCPLYLHDQPVPVLWYVMLWLFIYEEMLYLGFKVIQRQVRCESLIYVYELTTSGSQKIIYDKRQSLFSTLEYRRFYVWIGMDLPKDFEFEILGIIYNVCDSFTDCLTDEWQIHLRKEWFP